MVDSYKTDFARLAKIYVTNKGYPSIHVYTVDDALIAYLHRTFSARVIPHVGTTDVVITKRVDLEKAARVLVTCGEDGTHVHASTLLLYTRCDNLEKRRLIMRRLQRQLKVTKRSNQE